MKYQDTKHRFKRYQIQIQINKKRMLPEGLHREKKDNETVRIEEADASEHARTGDVQVFIRKIAPTTTSKLP